MLCIPLHQRQIISNQQIEQEQTPIARLHFEQHVARQHLSPSPIIQRHLSTRNAHAKLNCLVDSRAILYGIRQNWCAEHQSVLTTLNAQRSLFGPITEVSSAQRLCQKMLLVKAMRLWIVQLRVMVCVCVCVYSAFVQPKLPLSYASGSDRHIFHTFSVSSSIGISHISRILLHFILFAFRYVNRQTTFYKEIEKVLQVLLRPQVLRALSYAHCVTLVSYLIGAITSKRNLQNTILIILEVNH